MLSRPLRRPTLLISRRINTQSQPCSERRAVSNRKIDATPLDGALGAEDEQHASPSPCKGAFQEHALTSLISSQVNLQDDAARRKSSLQSRAATLIPLASDFVKTIEPLTASDSASNHHDLPSFLRFTKRNNINTTTTVYKGTLFEYTVAETVKRYGMALERVGKANDFGIDLRGYWTRPSTTGRLPVIVQCKLSKPSPQVVRELEGTYAGAPAAWRGGDAIALLASRHKATPGVVQAVQRSSSPIGFMQVTSGGHVQQFLWNSRAADNGLAGVGVTMRHHHSGHNTEAEPHVNRAVALTWLGRPWVPAA